MSNRPRFAVTRLAVTWLARSWSAVAVVVTGLALGVVATGLGNTDRLVATSFASALQSTAATPAFATRPASGLVQLSGSEEYWLNARTPADAAMPVALTDPLRLGDQVTFASGGRERRLEVVDIRPVGDAATTATGSLPSASLMLITCRDLAAPAAHPVRFVIEKDDTPAGGARRAPHAL